MQTCTIKKIPQTLQNLKDLFSPLDEDERRELLCALAQESKKYRQNYQQTYFAETYHKDPICTDTVGIHLFQTNKNNYSLHVSLGPHVQTLTKAFACILCKTINNLSEKEILELQAEDIHELIGTPLVKQRSQITHYLLNRIKTTILKN
jgi:cysteine desulfuration protein SufE